MTLDAVQIAYRKGYDDATTAASRKLSVWAGKLAEVVDDAFAAYVKAEFYHDSYGMLSASNTIASAVEKLRKAGGKT